MKLSLKLSLPHLGGARTLVSACTLSVSALLVLTSEPALAFKIVGAANSLNGLPVAEIMSRYHVNLKRRDGQIKESQQNQRPVAQRSADTDAQTISEDINTYPNKRLRRGSSGLINPGNGLIYLAREDAPKLRASAKSLPTGNAPVNTGEVARIVAVVNNEPITYADLLTRVQMLKVRLAANNAKIPPRAELERATLQRMILDVAQLQLARLSGIIVSNARLEAAIERIAADASKSISEFRNEVEVEQNMPFERFREALRDELTISRLREREVRVTVSEREVDNYMTMRSAVGQGTEYRLSHILIRSSSNLSAPEERRKKLRAMQMIRRLKVGQQFDELALVFSEAPDANDGGDLGWRPLDRLPKLFQKLVVDMKPGEISEVVRSPAGFHVLHLKEVRHADAGKAIEQTRVRHILLRTTPLVSDEDAANRLHILRERILQGEDFAALARLNSQDTAAIEGNLGWVYPGDTVPEFEQAMRALKLDEISEPVQTPFGWHLIQVLERRTAPISEDRRRQNARLLLRQRKMEEGYEEWLQQLKDSTYIENRLEPVKSRLN